MFACGRNADKAALARLASERDSLLNVNQMQREDLDELSSYVGVIAVSLDSIATHERIWLTTKDQDGYTLSKKRIRENLTYFEELLNRQQQQIQMLEDSLAMDNSNAGKLREVITYLSQQLKEKNLEIQSIKSELAQKNFDIQKLQRRVEALQVKTRVQEEALLVQDNIINECYVRIGTRKELKQDGLLAFGGVLNSDNIDMSKFMKVDIREFTDIPVNATKFKILTAMPESAYQIVKSETGFHINITDPTMFWSVSNFLIIQTN